MRTPRTKTQRQYAAIERAKFNLDKALARIEYEESVILPGLEKIAKAEAEGKTVTLSFNNAPLEIEA